MLFGVGAPVWVITGRDGVTTPLGWSWVLAETAGVTTVVAGPGEGVDPVDSWTSLGRGTRVELSDVWAAETDASVNTMAATPGIAHQGDFIADDHRGSRRR